MINVPENFKIDLRTYGRQFNIKLKVNNSDFNADNLNTIKPSFTTPLFKTIMHQLELESKVYMPKDTKISGRIGVKVNEKVYKYIDLNTYYVQSCERQEDTNSYRILAYTKMKEAMIDYDLETTEKLTVRDYLIRICERLGWNTNNIPATFINSEKIVDPNLHTGINYSFRDALDELATITCSFLFFDGDNFYLKYFNDAICYQEKSGQSITFQSELKSMIKLKKLEGKSTQNETPTPSNPVNIRSIGDNGNVIINQTSKNKWNNDGFSTSIPNENLEKSVTGFKFTRNDLSGGKYVSNTIDIKANQKIIFSCNISNMQQSYLALYKNAIYETLIKSDWAGKIEYTATEDETIVFSIIINSGCTETEVSDIQIEFEQQSPYEPYFFNTYTIPLSEPLMSLKDGTKDTLESDGIHRRVKKVVYDGSDDEQWTEYTNYTNRGKKGYCYYISDNTFALIPVSVSQNTGSSISNYFKNTYACWSSYGYIGAFSDHQSVTRKYFIVEQSTLADFKKWLSTHPIEIIYKLNTETIEPYTDEQKEIINSMITEKGTNIFELENQATINCPIKIQEIDESYLDEDNVTVGEKYFINSLVFSRAEKSDNIYRKDDNSITENGLHEYRIADCQLLSTNDRSDYIDEMFNYLKTLEFYIFDIQSKGILFLEACDLFNLKLNNLTYKTVLLNDEINIDDGLTENLYLDKPEETETEYKYADETDKKIDQTNFIVNKQEKKIQGLISQIGDRSEKTTTITADIDGLNSKVEEIATLINTVTGKRVTLENCAYSEIGELVITGDIEVLTLADDVIGHYGTVPMPNLAPLGTLAPSKPQKQSKAVYVSDNTYLLDTTLIHIKPDNTMVKISLPDFTLRTLGEIKDEFHIKDGKAYVIQKIELDDAGYKYALDETKTIELGAIELVLEEGTNTLYMEGFPNATLIATYMTKNELAKGFATKAELSSSIKQTSKEIDLSVDKKLENYSTTEEMNASINVTAEEINQEVSKKVGNDEIISKINQSAEAVKILANKLGLTANDVIDIIANNIINLTSKSIVITSDNFNLDKNGNLICNNATMSNIIINNGQIRLNGDDDIQIISILKSDGSGLQLENKYITLKDSDRNGISLYSNLNGEAYIQLISTGGTTQIKNTGITTPKLTQTSREENKKNFEKFNNGLDVVKSTEIYKYHLKPQKDTDKKEIGFVIGEDFKYSHDITSIDEKGEEIGVDTYSMVSVAYKAIQEQQEIIEQLQNKINELEEKIND